MSNLTLILTESSIRLLFPINGVPKIVAEVVTATQDIRMLYGLYRTYTLDAVYTFGPSGTSSVEGSLATQPAFMEDGPDNP
jgi:hypothetical protein